MTRQHQGDEGLVRDQRGAIMVMGVFMAALLVGFLYYVKGLGGVIAIKERMQDAADTGAFSSAVIYARGMNIIALLNIVGAAVLAAAVAARAIGTVGAVATLIATYTVGLTGQLGAGQDFCGVNQSGHDAAFSALYRRALSVMASARTAANALRTGIPLAAQAQVTPAVVETYRPLVDDAFLWPFQSSLPVADATTRVYCERAAGPAGALTRLPFAAGGVAGAELFGTGVVAFHALEISRQMCTPRDSPPALGSGGGRSSWGPLPQEAFDCLSCESDGVSCGEAQALLDRIHDRSDDGGCNTPECEENAARARRHCNPDPPITVTAARFQLCSQVTTVVGNGQGGPAQVVSQGEPEDCELREAEPLPCSTPYDEEGDGIICETDLAVDDPAALVADREVQPNQPPGGCEPIPDPLPGGAPSEAEFLRDPTSFAPGYESGCDDGYACIDPPGAQGPQCLKKRESELEAGERLELPAVRVVTVVHQCAFPVEETRVEAFDVPQLPDSTVPQRLLPGVGPGSEVFQVWAVAGGRPGFRRKEGGVKVAAWGRDRELSDEQRGLLTMGRVSLAAAEYYYDGDDAIDLWVWRMRWRARLVRYRLPEVITNASSCAGHGVYCEALDEMMQRGLDDAVVH